MNRRCIGKQCLDGPAEDGEPRPRWADSPSLLCRRCGDRLERHLAELPARRDMLRSVLGGLSSRAGSGNRPTKGEPPVPLNVAAHDHLELLQATVVSWVLLVTEERTLRGPDRPDLNLLSAWLVSQHDWLLQQLWVDDLAEEMRDLSQVADTLTSVRPRWNRLPVPCPVPECGHHDLGRWDGSDEVVCNTCGTAWPEADYARLVRVLTDRETVTAEQGAVLAGVAPQTFRKWVTENRVRRAGTLDGQARYWASDVPAKDGAA